MANRAAIVKKDEMVYGGGGSGGGKGSGWGAAGGAAAAAAAALPQTHGSVYASRARAAPPIDPAFAPTRRHTKQTLAAIAVGVPYEVGIVKRTKASLATSMQRQPDDEFAREQRAVLDELAADAERHGAADIAAFLDPSLFVELAREAEEAERNKKKKAPATAAAQARGGTAGGAVVKAEVGRPPADPGPVGMVVTAVLTEDVGGAVAAEQDAGDDDVVAFEVVQPSEADGGAIAAVVVGEAEPVVVVADGVDAQCEAVAMVVDAEGTSAAAEADTGGVSSGVSVPKASKSPVPMDGADGPPAPETTAPPPSEAARDSAAAAVASADAEGRLVVAEGDGGGGVGDEEEEVVEASQPSISCAVCPSGHGLVFNGMAPRGDRQTLTCDMCDASIPPSAARFTCSMCDYDLCRRCGQRDGGYNDGGAGAAAAGMAPGGSSAAEAGTTTGDGGAGEGEQRMVVRSVREYLVKFRGFSIARSKWMRADAIEADGKLSYNCLKRFLRRLADGSDAVDQTYKECMQLQRVIGHREPKQPPMTAPGEATASAASGGEAAADTTEYLVKWVGLPYEQCSWEPRALGFVPDEAVAAYNAQSNRAAADRAAEARRRQLGWLQIGSSVEVMPSDGAYAGSWCTAAAVTAPNDGLVGVEFDELYANDDDDPKSKRKRRQRVPLSRVRPLPPGSAAAAAAAAARAGGARRGRGSRRRWSGAAAPTPRRPRSATRSRCSTAARGGARPSVRSPRSASCSPTSGMASSATRTRSSSSSRRRTPTTARGRSAASWRGGTGACGSSARCRRPAATAAAASAPTTRARRRPLTTASTRYASGGCSTRSLRRRRRRSRWRLTWRSRRRTSRRRRRTGAAGATAPPPPARNAPRRRRARCAACRAPSCRASASW